MTAAIVAPLPVPPLSDVTICDPSAEARKRRREIMASQRSSGFVPEIVTSVNTIPAAAKKRKVSTDETIAKPTSVVTKPSKKPQMKYDPDVPMTKEEAAVWRREQRRKRNRESAAASRQRQRDRINELESEVQDWKVKYDAMMAKIRRLEQVTGTSSTTTPTTTPAEDECNKTIATSRPSTPQPISAQTVTPRASPTSTTSLVSPADKVVLKSEVVVTDGEQEEPPKMISQQAVKITGSICPLLPDDSLLAPEPCLSGDMVKLDPIDSTLFPCPETTDAEVLPDVHADPEFGEFLLDAVDWL